MTAETDLFAVPVIRDTVDLEEWRDACVSSATEALRAEVEQALACNRGLTRLNEATLERAERLAEALRHLRNHTSVNSPQIELIDAALEQEAGRE